jgi:hypothetical protein
LCHLRAGNKPFNNPPPYFAFFAKHYTMNIFNNHKFYLGGILLTALLSFSACEEIGLTDDPILDRGLYTGNVTYRTYTYLKDSSEPTLITRITKLDVPLKENKKGLFIEHNMEKHHFDIENNIEITTNDGYIKYKRTNNSIEVNNRSETAYSDSTIVILGNGTLEKQ